MPRRVGRFNKDSLPQDVITACCPADLAHRLLQGIKVDKGCWLWESMSSAAYATMFYNGKSRYIHRLIYQWVRKPLQPGKLLRHSCNMKRCVNPWHTIQSTQRQNMLDIQKHYRTSVRIASEKREEILAALRETTDTMEIAEKFRMQENLVDAVLASHLPALQDYNRRLREQLGLKVDPSS